MGAVKKKEALGILAVLGIGALEFLCTFQLYRGVRSGTVIPVRQAAAQPVLFLLQCLRECLLPAVLLILFAVLLKKDFASALYFKLRGRWQRAAAALLTAAILGFTLHGFVTKQDKASILVSLLYYLVVIAFSEEFVTRDACTWFLRDSSWPLRYLLPNGFFALLHLFLYAEWGEIGAEVLIRFFTTGTFFGYVSMGCLFQLFKEKSGGNLALGMVPYINDGYADTPMPSYIMAISPGTCVDGEEEWRRMLELDEKDVAIPAQYMKMAVEVMRHGDDSVPDYMLWLQRADFTGCPPVTLIYGTDETLYACAPAIEAALQKNGVNYEQILGEGMFHCYPVFPIVKEAREGWRQMVERMIQWRDET